MTKLRNSPEIWWVPQLVLLILLLHQTFRIPIVLALAVSTISSQQDNYDHIAERQVPKRTNCTSPDIECYPPDDWFYGVICCSPGNLCALSEKFDEAGVFHSYCVQDPERCLPGLFSCLPEINICCPDEYICDTRTWDNVTVPVCLSPMFHSNGTYTPPWPISTKPPQQTTQSTPQTTQSTQQTTQSTQQTTSQPTDHTQLPDPGSNVSGGEGGAQGGKQAYISTGTLAGLVVGVICSSVIITFGVGFMVLRYRKRRRSSEVVSNEPMAIDPSAQPDQPPAKPEPAPQQSESKYSPPGLYHEAGGNEILEAGGATVAELPGEDGDMKMWWNREGGVG